MKRIFQQNIHKKRASSAAAKEALFGIKLLCLFLNEFLYDNLIGINNLN